jgi:ABC-type phosphate/phosphonate transport system substrate-binding protein
MKKKAVIFVAALFVFVSLAPVFASAKTYTIVMPGTFSVSGKSKSQMTVFAEEIAKALSEVIGEPINLQTTNLAEEDFMKFAVAGLASKKIDVAGFNADWYAKFSPQMREKFPPLLGLLVNGKKSMNYCYYVRKEDGIKSIEQLKGKTLVTYTYRDPRYLLYKAGIDQPLEKYFGKVLYEIGVAPEYMKDLVEGKVDTFVSWDFLVDTARGVDPRFKNIQQLACKEYGLNSFMIYRGDLDHATIEKLQKAALNWDKDSHFKNVKFFFVAIKGGVFIPQSSDFDLSYAIDKLSVDRGWDAERKAFIKKNTK